MTVGNHEIIQIADAVSREKMIPKESIIDAMEQAIQVAARKKYGLKHNIKATIDRKHGEIKIYRVFEVVAKIDDVENIGTQISLADAQDIKSDIVIGEVIQEELPPIDLGRVAAQAAKQVIVQKVRDVERERQYEEFKDKVGEIVSGVVKRNEFGNYIVDIGRDEAFLAKDKVIPGESFRQNDRIRFLIENVQQSVKSPQINLSRTADEFLAKLFAQEVPEVYDRVIQIKAVSREPGSRAKMAVYSTDSSVDAVGSCVGVRGARVQAVISELQGEKIDIIQYSSDPGKMVVDSLAPAEVSKVVIDENANRIEVVVPTDQLSIAIGKRGQNVRLAGRLLGWKIDVLTEEQESKRRSEEFVSASSLFMEALDVEEVIGQLLASEGYTSVEEIAYVPASELASIEGFEEQIVLELQERALVYLNKENVIINQQVQEMGVDQEVIDILDVLTPAQILSLAENGVKKIEDIADLTVRDFNQIVGEHQINDVDLEKIIEYAKSKEDK
jgi:transcription termination/antitermination protein NusA